MHRRHWRDRLYGWLGWLELGFGIFAAISTGLLRVPVQTAQAWWPFAGRVLELLRGQEWWIVPLTIVLAGLCHFARKYLGPPWVWDTIHSTIGYFRDDVFDKVQNPTEDHHRVTLFRYHKRWRWSLCKWPWSGWLVAVARSGHQTQAKRPAFRAPDSSDDSQGVAGLAWGMKDWQFVPKKGESPLPDVLGDQTEENMQTYAERTNVKVRWLKHEIHKDKHPAMSFAAFRVQVKGKPWGVIVLDSREPEGIVQRGLSGKYSPYGKSITPLLGRV